MSSEDTPDRDRVDRITRQCLVDTRKGIARVELVLEGALLRRPVVIARVPKPFGRLRAEAVAKTPLGTATVIAHRTHDDECFWLRPILSESVARMPSHPSRSSRPRSTLPSGPPSCAT